VPFVQGFFANSPRTVDNTHSFVRSSRPASLDYDPKLPRLYGLSFSLPLSPVEFLPHWRRQTTIGPHRLSISGHPASFPPRGRDSLGGSHTRAQSVVVEATRGKTPRSPPQCPYRRPPGSTGQHSDAPMPPASCFGVNLSRKARTHHSRTEIPSHPSHKTGIKSPRRPPWWPHKGLQSSSWPTLFLVSPAQAESQSKL